ncbi:alkaline ceramidase 3 [Lingula anatina]|uniref:Alkaline ceramidase n=1 Tax=Lingula anatina TaxID=7574 RepID=A0A1S3HRJ7_LINAN|nr:alkaline ceramidase 3 [Lingula anatina]|eukprot:XP_013387674.1 alkaline ceramidase 3 [Lingula anatina]
MAPPSEKIGFWGPVTSTVDWCETNYEVSFYIAEFWNTISNVMMILPPLVGLLFAVKDAAEGRIVGCHIGLMLVGMGSWCFHMTLLYSSQLLDEMPMIWGTCFLIYTLYEVGSPPKSHNRILQCVLLLYCLFVTVVYTTTHNVIFFQVSYGIMVFAIVACSIQVYRNFEHSNFLLVMGILTYGTGFLLWNVDNLYCENLRHLRQWLPAALRPLTQMHAWWHVGAGIGTYTSIIYAAHARLVYLKKNPVIEGSLLPIVRPGREKAM